MILQWLLPLGLLSMPLRNDNVGIYPISLLKALLSFMLAIVITNSIGDRGKGANYAI